MKLTQRQIRKSNAFFPSETHCQSWIMACALIAGICRAVSLLRVFSTQGRKTPSQWRSGVAKPILSWRARNATGKKPRIARRNLLFLVPSEARRYSAGRVTALQPERGVKRPPLAMERLLVARAIGPRWRVGEQFCSIVPALQWKPFAKRERDDSRPAFRRPLGRRASR